MSRKNKKQNRNNRINSKEHSTNNNHTTKANSNDMINELKDDNTLSSDNDGNNTPYETNNDNEIVSLLTGQIRDLRTEYLSIQSRFLTMSTISFCGYGVMIYYAILVNNPQKSPVNYVFLVLPFLFGISFINILKYTVKMLGLGAYIAHLEQIINSKMKKNYFLWHSKLVYANFYNIVGIAHIPCNLALYVFVGFKFYENIKVFKQSNLIEHNLIWIFMIVMFVVILFSLVVCATQFHDVLYWSNELYNTPYDNNISTRIPHWIRKYTPRKK